MTRLHDQDHLIREAIKTELEVSPDPPLTRSEAWEQLSKQLPHLHPPMRPRRYNRYFKRFSLIATLVITAFISSMLMSQDSSGFNWFTRYWSTMTGTVTTLFISITEQPNEPVKGQPLPPVRVEQAIDKSVAFTKEMTLAEAAKAVNFSILVPEHVPEGYSLNHILVYFTEENMSNEVDMIYRNRDSELSIRQFSLVGSYNASSGIDHDDSQLRDLNLKGMQETLVHHENGSSTLIWNNSFMQLIIRSRLTEEELFKLINSM